MDLLLFSGNSLLHKRWIEEVEKTLKPLFDKTYIHYYKHWEDKSPVIYLDYELEEVSKVLSGYKDYAVFGKSAGTLLALKGINDGILKPEKCIFVGLPVEWGKFYGFEVDEWVLGYSLPTLFIQKSQDPVLYYDDLVRYLEEQNVSNHKTVEVPGFDHFYEDLDHLRELTEEFCATGA